MHGGSSRLDQWPEACSSGPCCSRMKQLPTPEGQTVCLGTITDLEDGRASWQRLHAD